jgi:hypothetical protein
MSSLLNVIEDEAVDRQRRVIAAARKRNLVCRKCEKMASMVHVAPGLFTQGPAGLEAKRALAQSKGKRP